jgi:molybdopterin-guanine dinucleotide biosynthesis protein A
MFRRVMVVARQREALAGLEAEVLTDDRPEQGPLVGLARGLAASDASWCFVTGCDMPLLNPAVICLMAENLAGCEILMPSLDGNLQPLHAFYSQDCLPRARELLDNGVTSMVALLSRCQTRTMAASDFMGLDPGLRSFMDVDTQDDYRAVQKLSEGFL